MSDKISARECSSNVIVSTGPDVCLTPVGSSLVPVAYTTVAFAGDSERVSSTVLDNESPDFHLNSRTCTSTGHEAGVGAGMVLPGYQGEALVTTASPTVFTDGWASCRHRDPAMINRPDAGAVEPQIERTNYYEQMLRRIAGREESPTLEACYAEDVEANMPARDLEPGTNESVESANGSAMLVAGASAPPEKDWRQREGETDEEYVRRLEEEVVHRPRPRTEEQLREAIADAEGATEAIVTHPNYHAWGQKMDPAMFHDPLSFDGVSLDENMARVARPNDVGHMREILKVGSPYDFVGADGNAYNTAGESVLPRFGDQVPVIGEGGTLAKLNGRYKEWRAKIGDPVPEREMTLAERMEIAKTARDGAKRMNRLGVLITGNGTGPYTPDTAGMPDVGVPLF